MTRTLLALALLAGLSACAHRASGWDGTMTQKQIERFVGGVK